MSDPRYKNVGTIETRVIEECSELIQILCKVQRFGWLNWHPDDLKKTSNLILVGDEIRDLIMAIVELKEKMHELELSQGEC